MARKVFQDFANTLPAMLVGWRMADDLETLAELPDGTLTVDVLAGSTTHSAAPGVCLHIAEELQAWLRNRMVNHNIGADDLNGAIVTAQISTDHVATNRKRIVAFVFECKATLNAGTRSYVGTLNEKHVWHRRPSA